MVSATPNIAGYGTIAVKKITEKAISKNAFNALIGGTKNETKESSDNQEEESSKQ